MKARVLFVFCLFIFANSFGNKFLYISDNEEDVLVPTHTIEILEDKSNQLSLQKVVNHSGFIINTLPTPYIANTSSTYWTRFTVKYKTSEEKRRVLEILDPHFLLLEVYVRRNDSLIMLQGTGFSLPFVKREYLHKNFIFDIPGAVDSTYTFYIKAQSDNHNVFLYKIRTSQFFTYYALNEYFLLGIFYGILLIMALYNFFIWVSVKEKFYLYYVIYVFSAALLCFSEDGLGFQYIWPDFPSLNKIITFYSPSLFLICFTIYSLSFLEINRQLPVVNKIVWITVFSYCIYYTLDLKYFDLSYRFPFYLIPFMLIYLSAVIVYFRGYRPARYYVAGYSFVGISMIILFLRMKGLINLHDIFTVYSFNIGLVIEIVILSFALGDRIKIIKQEKEEAQQRIIEQLRVNEKLKDKVNRELEQKVAERTKEIFEQKEIISKQNEELQLANADLKAQSEEIERMNELLYKENEELQVNVKELTKARVMLREVDFSEFLKIFPDKESCLKYLAELKWTEDYVCKKCANNKFFEGHEVYSRRCTKCGYDESATAFTIFHKLKFDLNKAFYLLFLVYANKDKITTLELSRIISLRQSTCWSFRKKITEKMQKKKKYNYDEAGWSWLILDSKNKSTKTQIPDNA
ncbi:MAG: 7TM diverse intracellular signaling domain-containing protein [Cytophagaceae bacterium]